MKWNKHIAITLCLLIATPSVAHAGWLTWLRSMLRTESKVAIRSEVRSGGTTLARTESRSVAGEAAQTTAASITRVAVPATRSTATQAFRAASTKASPNMFRIEVGTVSKSAALKADAAALVPKNMGRSRVDLRSEKVQMQVDLAGKAHANIPTPHTKISPRNTYAPEHLPPQYNTSEKNSSYRPSTHADLRIVRRHLDRKNR